MIYLKATLGDDHLAALERAMVDMENVLESDYCEDSLTKLLFNAGRLEAAAATMGDIATTQLNRLRAARARAAKA
jgi:hypothetical protein